MKRACFVSLYLFIAAALFAQSDSGSVANQPNRLPRPIPDFRRLVPAGSVRKMRVRPSMSALHTPQSSAALNFAPVVDYNSGGESAQSVAVADLNADGKPDVVVANQSNGKVGILLGNGGGTFQPVVVYNSGEEAAQSVAVADVNGDGRLDLLVAGCASLNSSGGCASGVVSVLMGNGDGTFQAAVPYDSGGGGGAEAVAVADVNGDGRLDLVVANVCASVDSNGDCTIVNAVVSVLLGNGDGSFQTAITYASGGQLATSVALADLNGDGRLDIVVANDCPSHSPSDGPGDLCQFDQYSVVGVLLGNGDGTFQPAAVYNSGGYYSISAAVADLNGDGKPDLVVGNGIDFWPDFENGAVGVLLGNGDGTFQPPVPYIFAGDGSSAALADVNGDGKPDLLVAGFACGSCASGDSGLGVLSGNGDGTFQPALVFDSGGFPRSIAVADVNGDRRPDLIMANGGVGVLTNTTPWPTTTALATSSNPANFAQSLTFTASVTSRAGGSPTGTATFSDGSTPLGTSPINGGTATFSTAVLTVGLHSINAVYSGDSNFSGNSTSLNQIVNQAPTTLFVTSSVNPAGLVQPVTFTAMITPQYGGQASGIVTFKDGATTLGSRAVCGNAASLSTGNLAIGTHSISAVYSGDSNFTGSTSNTLSQVVTKAATTTTLLSSVNPSVQGKSVAFTATVSSLAGTPTGKVAYLNGTNVLATVTLTSGAARYTTSKLPPGSNSITAVYVGDSNNSGSTSAPVSQFVLAATTTTLTSSPNSSFYGQAVIFTAGVSSSIGAPPDGETVTFKQGTTVLGTGTLSGGMATLSNSTLAVGTRGITAVYAGDANFATSTSKSLSQVVAKAASTTTLTSSQNPSGFDQAVTFTATVAPQFSGTPTGTVSFYNGTTKLRTTILTGSSANYTTTNLASGTESITAVYNGSSSFTTSTSPALSQVVNQASTTTALASSLNPSTFGQSVSVMATVAPQFNGTVTGSVTFTDGITTLKTVNLSGGSAKYTTTTLATGAHNITATYDGSTSLSGSSAVLTQTVN
jgi:Bacterial Ig-like domain (group 3)/FG-GAP-like repeat